MSIGGSRIDAAMKKEMVATYALLLAVRTSESCATVAATARPIARPTYSAEPRPAPEPRYVANPANAATATMYVAAHGESSWNWLMADGRLPVTRLKSLIARWPPLSSEGARLAVAPGCVAPDCVAPRRVAPDRVAPGGIAPGRVAPGRVAPGGGRAHRSGDVAPDHVAPDHVAPDHVAPDHVAPDHVGVGAGVPDLLGVGDGEGERRAQAG